MPASKDGPSFATGSISLQALPDMTRPVSLTCQVVAVRVVRRRLHVRCACIVWRSATTRCVLFSPIIAQRQARGVLKGPLNWLTAGCVS